jgi:triacylglycerol lipase
MNREVHGLDGEVSMSSPVVPKLRTPVVLVHGLFGFGRYKVAGCTVANYFPGIAEALEAAGNRVFVPSMSPTGGTMQRAGQLKEFMLAHVPNEPVHLIAHSLGGLDSRYMISKLGMADRVLTLTTLGTPHRGTSFADWGIRRLGRIAQPVLEFIGMPTQAFYDLTTTRCAAFNEQVPDAPSVRYFSVAGQHHGDIRNPEWLLSHRIVTRAEGSNDGIVAVESARYGEQLDVWEGDHLSLVNQLHPLTRATDPTPRYAKLMGRLADLGY